MKNDNLRFIIDSRCFDGSCLTVMSDGIHSDYGHETLEELRERENNPSLIAVPGNAICKKCRSTCSLSAPRSVKLRKRTILTIWTPSHPSGTPGISFHERAVSCRHSPVLLPDRRTVFYGAAFCEHTKKGFGTANGQTLPEGHIQRRHPQRKPMGIFDHTRHSFTVIVPYLFLDKMERRNSSATW